MTQVTALERAVIRNIAVAMRSSAPEIMIKDLSKGPEAIKPNQVNAVVLNLTRKGLVAVFNSEAILLTEAGGEVHTREFPVAKDLDTLRHESNLELSKVQPMSVEELVLTNKLIDLRKSVNKVETMLMGLQVALISDRLLKEALEDQHLAA